MGIFGVKRKDLMINQLQRKTSVSNENNESNVNLLNGETSNPSSSNKKIYNRNKNVLFFKNLSNRNIRGLRFDFPQNTHKINPILKDHINFDMKQSNLKAIKQIKKNLINNIN